MKKIFLLLSAYLLLYSGAMAQPLIAHYDFNGNTNDAVNSLTATPVGTFIPGYFTGSPVTGSQAIRLTNGDQLQVPYSALLNNASWTMTAIVKWAGAAPTTVTSIIAERYTNAGYGLSHYGTDYMSAEIFNTKLYGSGPNHVNSFPATAPTITTGQWYCLTVTYDNVTGTLNTYAIDPSGTSTSTTSWVTTYTPTGTSKLYIGAPLNYGFIGDIDDIKIYSGVLTPTQVSTACSNFPSPTGNPWITTGNNTSTTPGNIFGTTNVDDVLIQTSGVQRGMIHRSGSFGIGTGTATPTATLHVNTNGNGIRFQGLPIATLQHNQSVVADPAGNLAVAPFGTGTNWALNGNSIASTPTTWIGTNDPFDFNIHAGGFHRGRVTKDGNLDFGNNTIPASTIVSSALGSGNTITDARMSFIAGENNTISHTHYQYKSNPSGCSILGTGNTLDSSDETTVLGEDNDVFNAHGTIVAGGHNQILNSYGRANHKSTLYQGIIGCLNTIDDGVAYSGDEQFAYIMGARNSIQQGQFVDVIGSDNAVNANNTVVLGSHLTNTADNAIIAGINGVRTATMTDRGMGVMVSNLPNYTPGHNLEVDARVMPGQPVQSNIAFMNLPISTRLPVVLVDPNTGELFMSKDREYTLTGGGDGTDPELAEAVKVQQEQIKTLKEQNDDLKTRLTAYDQKLALLEKSIANICESGCPGLRGVSNTTPPIDGLGNTDKLYQSIPNPTDGKAIINYSLGRNYEHARIVIANTEGRIVQTINVSPKAGNGSTTVELGTLASQTYVYTLYVDDHIVDSKKLIVIK